jgi:hypothetical protein
MNLREGNFVLGFDVWAAAGSAHCYLVGVKNFVNGIELGRDSGETML